MFSEGEALVPLTMTYWLSPPLIRVIFSEVSTVVMIYFGVKAGGAAGFTNPSSVLATMMYDSTLMIVLRAEALKRLSIKFIDGHPLFIGNFYRHFDSTDNLNISQHLDFFRVCHIVLNSFKPEYSDSFR